MFKKSKKEKEMKNATLDFSNMNISDLEAVDYKTLTKEQLSQINKRVLTIKKRYDWYIQNGGVRAMIDDGIDVAQFKVDYNRLELIGFKLHFAEEKLEKNDNLEEYQNSENNNL